MYVLVQGVSSNLSSAPSYLIYQQWLLALHTVGAYMGAVADFLGDTCTGPLTK